MSDNFFEETTAPLAIIIVIVLLSILTAVFIWG